MVIVWDEVKRQANIAKHGLDFAELDEAYLLSAVIVPARDNRLKAIGMLRDSVVSAVFAPLGSQGISVISLRRANSSERRLQR